MNAKRILVTGATGQQGGAVARHLLKHNGFAVRALVRDPNKPAAQALVKLGVELLRGDLEELPSVKRALEGAYAAYSVQTPDDGPDAEIRQGKAFADAARSAGLQHLVYSSVVSADKDTGIPHFESKWEIEQYIHELKIPFTIIRPAFFMQNWHHYLREPILNGTIPLPMEPQTSLQQISVEDIGEVAAIAFAHPHRWTGKTIELAGEDLTMTQAAEKLTGALGRNVKYVQVPWEQFREQAGGEMAQMYRWFEDVGYAVDIAALRKEFPFLQKLDEVLRQQDWKGTETAARKAA
jgi:uncharacterized protein YbjT (DUF2867 family)